MAVQGISHWDCAIALALAMALALALTLTIALATDLTLTVTGNPGRGPNPNPDPNGEVAQAQWAGPWYRQRRRPATGHFLKVPSSASRKWPHGHVHGRTAAGLVVFIQMYKAHTCSHHPTPGGRNESPPNEHPAGDHELELFLMTVHGAGSWRLLAKIVLLLAHLTMRLFHRWRRFMFLVAYEPSP